VCVDTEACKAELDANAIFREALQAFVQRCGGLSFKPQSK
jgi:hypothetical protein